MYDIVYEIYIIIPNYLILEESLNYYINLEEPQREMCNKYLLPLKDNEYLIHFVL